MRAYSYFALTRRKVELNQIADKREEEKIKQEFIDADTIFVEINVVP